MCPNSAQRRGLPSGTALELQKFKLITKSKIDMKKMKLLTSAVLVANLLLAAVMINSCGYVCGYSVKQEVREMKYSSETNFVTYVWQNGIIVQAWYDPIDSVNSELVKRRQVQADSLIAALKNSR